MAGTRNEICSKLWAEYQRYRGSDKDSYGEHLFNFLKLNFAFELYHGARLEMNETAANAASQTISLSGPQSLVLQKLGKLTDKHTIKLVGSSDVLVNMGQTIITDIGVNWETGEVKIQRTDGINDIEQFGKLTFEFRKDDKAWVLEPFVAKDEAENPGKVWSLMSAEERKTLTPSLRNPSSMPKYLQSRRVVIDNVGFNHDGREAWAEVTYKEIEAFSKSEAEEQSLLQELGISAAQATASETNGDENASASTETDGSAAGELAEREAPDPEEEHAPFDPAQISDEDIESLIPPDDDDPPSTNTNIDDLVGGLIEGAKETEELP